MVIALLTVALAAVAAPAAGAEFGFEPGSVQATSLDAGGQPETQAGAHPDTFNIGFAFTQTPDGSLEANARDIAVDLPTGYNGDATATPLCRRAEIAVASCPPETQVGVATIVFGGETDGITMPIFNVVPQPGVTAEFAMVAFLFPVRLDVSVSRQLRAHVSMTDIVQEFPLAAGQITLWGVPADHQTDTTIPRRALLTLPTSCGVSLRTDLSVRTWEQPNGSLTASAASGQVTGCGSLDFSPTATVAPDATTVDTLTGLHVGIDLPQHRGADELATAAPSQATVTLPAGMELASSTVQGLAVCSGAQFALGSDAPQACPAASRIGTVEIDTPLLDDPLHGDVFVGTPDAGDVFQLFLTAAGPGFTVKLPGSLRRDPASGRLVATIDDLPQAPISRIALDVAGGPRALFATPLACGRQTASVVLASWAGRVSAPATSTVAFGGPGGAPCSAPPPVDAGVSPPTADAHSAPSVRAARGHGRQRLASRIAPFGGTARKPGVRVSLRRSGTAIVRSVAVALPRVLRLDARAPAQLCRRAQAREDRCPAASRVGSALLRTPSVRERMSASLYAVASRRRGGPPGLWASLAGGGVRVVLDGVTAVRRNGQVTSTFAGLPDVPLTAFELRLRGGAHGLLSVDSQRCRLPRAQRRTARVAVRSQGGASASQALATGPWRRCLQRR